MKTFSTAWSPEDRLRLVLLLTHMIREDIHAGHYGGEGRPNIQSVHEVIIAPAHVLEVHRAAFDQLVDVFGRERLFEPVPEWTSEEN